MKLSITPLENEPGQLIVITDLTETRQLQARVSHMQRLSSLGKMVASLAHQIRTPLSAAMLYASNLTRKGLGQEAQTQFANKLTDRLKELESQVNDMLLFAKQTVVGVYDGFNNRKTKARAMSFSCEKRFTNFVFEFIRYARTFIYNGHMQTFIRHCSFYVYALPFRSNLARVVNKV